MTNDEIVAYWLNSADIDSKAMENLFSNGHYTWSLFVGHLVLEKLLKAYYVKSTGTDIPYIHDLLGIAKKGNLIVTDEQADFLDEVTTFNIRLGILTTRTDFTNEQPGSLLVDILQK